MRAPIKIVLAIASFVIYASAVIALPRHTPYIAEREAFAAAVSTTVYGAPIGTIYSGAPDPIWDNDTPLEAALKQAIKPGQSPDSLEPIGGEQGNGLGYLVVTTWAMFLFGPHAYAPIWAMLALMGISAAAFLWRFGENYAVVVLLYFVALTVLLFTPVVYVPNMAQEIPIGGIRYFSVVGTLPAFHLALELLNFCTAKSSGWLWRFLLLGIQVPILVLGALTRTSTASLFLAIGVIGLFGLWKDRRQRALLWRQIGHGLFIAGVAGGFIALIVTLMPPNYLSDGRFSGVVWHRAFISLGLNPAWPFGNLSEVYDCDYAPGNPGLALKPGLLDSNGACVWFHYLHTHNVQWRLAMNSKYELILRDAVLDVIRRYPRQVLRTEVYKLGMLGTEFKYSMLPKISLRNYSLLLKALFCAAILTLLAFLVIPPVAPEARRSLQLVGLTLLFGFSAFPGYFVAWPGTSQTFDLKLYTLIALCMALNSLVVGVDWIALARGKKWIDPGRNVVRAGAKVTRAAE